VVFKFTAKGYARAGRSWARRIPFASSRDFAVFVSSRLEKSCLLYN
jgi:hypothetical protein